MKKLILIISLIFFLIPYSLWAADEDIQKGAELYWQATHAMSVKDFSGTQKKFGDSFSEKL